MKKNKKQRKLNMSLRAMTSVMSVLLCFSPINSHAIYDLNSGFENVQTKEITTQEFLNELINSINETRSFKGLLTLEKDDVGNKTANDHARELIKKGNLSHYNLEWKNPDERYTHAGGTGAVIEIIKGFEQGKNEKKIILNELLIKQLIEAINLSEDDSRVFYSPYLTHIGCGVSLSKDKKKLVTVLEFLTKGGEFRPFQAEVRMGEKISIEGKINPPFKFKAISIGYFNESIQEIIEDENNLSSFESENLRPYFPPQDYIAFGDTRKVNLLKVVKGIGFVGAIVGAPFTGGATAVLAPAILSSIQNGPPREIPLKKGIKANSKGEFSGKIELNYQNMTGLYFVNILAELPSVEYPIVVSRRTIKVVSPLKVTAIESERHEAWQ